MEKSAVESILSGLKGVTKKKNVYTVSSDARVVLLLKYGLRPLQPAALVLNDDHLLSQEGEDATETYLDYEAIVGITTRALEKTGRRAGF